MKASKKALLTATRYFDLTPTVGYPDTNAAITLAKALLQSNGRMERIDLISLTYARDFLEDALVAADDRGFEMRARRAIKTIDRIIRMVS